MVAFFIDLKAAFDLIDRRILVKEMSKREIRKGLVDRIEEMLRETRYRVRVKGELGERFWTARGVR